MTIKRGVYKIENLVNGKVYVGSATNLKTRTKDHFRKLKSSNHENRYLQASWNKHGENSFKLDILLYCNRENLLYFEQKYIDYYRDKDVLYNICMVAGNCLGRKMPEEQRKRMSENRKGSKNTFYGKKHTEETKRLISKRNTGKVKSKEARKKLSKSNTGKIHSEETKLKISLAQRGELNHRYGKKVSQEIRDRISKKLSGKSRGPCSDETKLKISAANKGREVSQETREKLSIAGRGRKQTEEHIRKNSEARQRCVISIDKDNNIKFYESITFAANEEGLCKSSITKCCKHPEIRKSCGGFRWKYAS